MGVVNDRIREEARIAMLRQRVTQTALAERTGLSRQHINHLLTGHRGGVAAGWLRILDELGLELVVVPKGK